MPFSLPELRDIALAAGVRDAYGIPLAALIASIAMEESRGNTLAVGDRSRPGLSEHAWAALTGGPAKGAPNSFGLLQVHAPAWPEIAATTRELMGRRMPDFGRAVAQVKAARPILEDAARQAARSAETLARRGFAAGPVELMLLMDAAWQGPLGNWAENTSTGNIGEIRIRTSPGRTERVRAHLAQLGVVGTSKQGLAALGAFLGLGGLVALVLWMVGELDS